MKNMKKSRVGLRRFRVVAALALLIGLIGASVTAQTTAPNPLNDSSAQASLNAYKSFAQYPPDNMAINSSNWDLLHPALVESQPLLMMPQTVLDQVAALKASGASGDDIRSQIAVPLGLPLSIFKLNKVVVVGTQDRLVAQLTIIPGSSPNAVQSASGTFLPFQITKAELIGDSRFGSPRLGAVPFSCNSSSDCTLSWQPPNTQKKYWGSMTLLVTATVQGFGESLVARQDFYSSPMTAGRFTGRFAERLQDGSLVVEAGVEVREHMLCFVSANLFSADQGVPTHHVERRMIVDPSMKTIPLTFFGKIFRDYGYEGTFRLQDLQARCTNLPYPAEWAFDPAAHRVDLEKFWQGPQRDSEPAHIYFEFNNHIYITGRYANGQFSALEWQSAEKSHKLAMYEQTAKELDNPAMGAQKRELQKQLEANH
jgi:hypothetical protein